MGNFLRVLHVMHSLEPGGMENGVVNYVRLLEGSGFQIGICCLAKTGAFQKRLPSSVPVYCLEKEDGFSWKWVRELRDKASTALGDRFDIRAFHNQVLETGCVPLQLLEAKIDRWIATQ